jgi:hypothetical protein
LSALPARIKLASTMLLPDINPSSWSRDQSHTVLLPQSYVRRKMRGLLERSVSLQIVPWMSKLKEIAYYLTKLNPVILSLYAKHNINLFRVCCRLFPYVPRMSGYLYFKGVGTKSPHKGKGWAQKSHGTEQANTLHMCVSRVVSTSLVKQA